MAGIAWATCWPAALLATRDNNPIPLLLGATCAVLPDTFAHWLVKPLHRPDIHVVPPPEAPDPTMIAEALAQAVSLSHNSGRTLSIECYPIPLGPDQWMPYTIHFDSAHQQISVYIPPADPASAPTPAGFVTDHFNRLPVDTEPISFQTRPLADGRIIFQESPSQNTWTHSLLTAFVIGTLATLIWGLTSGIISGGAYTLHIFTDQWGFSGSALFWPLSQNRHSGFHWVKPHQTQVVAFTLWGASLLLIAGNLLHTASPTSGGLSLFQLLLFGSVIPFALYTLLNKAYSQSAADALQDRINNSGHNSNRSPGRAHRSHGND